MNFINEKYPKIFSPPSTKKTYISSSYNIHSNNNDNNNNNNIPTPSPSRKVHIKRSGSVVIDQGGQQTIIHSTPSFNESNRRTNDNNNNMNMNTNYSNNTVTNKIPIQRPTITGMNDTSPLLSPSDQKQQQNRYIEEEIPRMTLDQLGGITVPIPEEQPKYDSIISNYNTMSMKEETAAQNFENLEQTFETHDELNTQFLKLTDTISKHVAYIGHHKEGVRHSALVGLLSALDGKFERIDLRPIITNLVVPSLLVLIEQQPPLINEVLPGVEPGRCHALALKTFGECGANAVREGVPRLLEFLRRLAQLLS